MSTQHEPSLLTSVTPAVLLGNHFRALKLPAFAREYEKVAKESAQDRADYPRYLLRLCELERAVGDLGDWQRISAAGPLDEVAAEARQALKLAIVGP